MSIFRNAMVLVVAALLLGCPKEEETEKKSDDDSSEKKAEPVAEKADNGQLAYSLGRKYGFACIFSLLDKADAAAKNIAQSGESAKALGVTPPTAPTKENAMTAMRATELGDEIKKKHDEKVAAAYALGVTSTDCFFGVALGSEISSQLADAEKHARAAGIPEDKWKAKLDAAKASSTEASVGALTEVFDSHFSYKE